MVNAMRNGQNIVFDFFKAKPDFNKVLTSEEIFPAEQVFNWQEWRKKDNYIKYVKHEEMYGPGGMNTGLFYMNSKFFLTFITNLKDKEDLDEFCAGIPHHNKMMKVIIT